jgi:hypothetical protein
MFTKKLILKILKYNNLLAISCLKIKFELTNYEFSKKINYQFKKKKN